MKKLEYEIKETLILAIVGKNYISDDTRRKFSLPTRLGGLGFLDQCQTCTLRGSYLRERHNRLIPGPFRSRCVRGEDTWDQRDMVVSEIGNLHLRRWYAQLSQVQTSGQGQTNWHLNSLFNGRVMTIGDNGVEIPLLAHPGVNGVAAAEQTD